MTPAAAVYQTDRVLCHMWTFSRSRFHREENSLTVRQSVAAGLQPSAFHACTWALLMQEDCLLYRGLDSSPSRPKMGSRMCGAGR
jgi:hypothetical protein